jgi:hypothetical protein
MDIFRAFAENEFDRYLFFFTYEPSSNEVLYKLENIVGYTPYVYDIFPEPHQFDKDIEEPLSVITKLGTEMFIPVGLNVQVFDTFRILYGEEE